MPQGSQHGVWVHKSSPVEKLRKRLRNLWKQLKRDTTYHYGGLVPVGPWPVHATAVPRPAPAQAAPDVPAADFELLPDPSAPNCIRAGDDMIRLTPKQGQVFAALYRAWRDGEHDLTGRELLNMVESDSESVRDLFRRSPAWRRFVKQTTKGHYRLNFPPKN